jgi:hypothetical protein
MSEPPTPVAREGWERLPPRLRPRAVELRGSGQLRLVETTLLLLLGLLLAVATVNDVGRQTGINQRLIADESTWRHYTGHDYRNLSIDQELLGKSTQREVVCGNTTPGPPRARTQICLVIWGRVVHGRRTAHGGWYLPAKVEDDVAGSRFGCFGGAGEGFCRR